MKILYGVQATGNGHISRAVAMSTALAAYPDVEITWLYSGRPKEELFGVADDFLWRRGMTFATSDGKVSYLKTAITNNFIRLVSDIRSLDPGKYDQMVVDYEPVTAWAAKLRSVPTIGIGHQYAFNFKIPLAGDNFISRSVMKYFAPATKGVGLHWHHFGFPILPPIVDLEGHQRQTPIPEKVVVYLPFEDQSKVIGLLRKIESHDFYLYGPGLDHEDIVNVHTRPLSRHGFKQDLVSASSVLCNSGFELVSECLSMGIRVMTKPLDAQVEQISNAFALSQLGYATVATSLDRDEVAHFLETGDYIQISYPAVHFRLAEWLVKGCVQSQEDLATELWRDVKVSRSRGIPELNPALAASQSQA